MSQLKIKNGNNWENIPAGGIGVPSGGNAGDVLVKSSAVDYATEWESTDSIIDPSLANLYIAEYSGPSASLDALAQNIYASVPDGKYFMIHMHRQTDQAYNSWFFYGYKEDSNYGTIHCDGRYTNDIFSRLYTLTAGTWAHN